MVFATGHWDQFVYTGTHSPHNATTELIALNFLHELDLHTFYSQVQQTDSRSITNHVVILFSSRGHVPWINSCSLLKLLCRPCMTLSSQIQSTFHPHTKMGGRNSPTTQFSHVTSCLACCTWTIELDSHYDLRLRGSRAVRASTRTFILQFVFYINTAQSYKDPLPHQKLQSSSCHQQQPLPSPPASASPTPHPQP